MSAKSSPLDLEALKESSDGLDQSQNEAIKASVFERMNRKDEKPTLEDEEDPFKAPLPEKQDTAEAESEDEDADKAKDNKDDAEPKEDEAKPESDKKADAEPEEDRSKAIEAVKAKPEAERTEEEKAMLQEHLAAEESARKEAIQRDAKEYALEHGVTEKEALKQVEHFYNVRSKFKDDPKEMSKALYHLNAKLTQQAQELAAIKNAPKEGEVVIGGKKLSKDEFRDLLVEKYREAHRELTDDLDDDKVHALAKKEFDDRVRIESDKRSRHIQDAAEKKKQSILESLPEADKRFAKTIGTALSRVSTADLAAEDFSAEDYIAWARGQFYHSDMADAEKRGYERAMKEKKILGQKPENASGAGSGAPSKKGGGAGLTPDEQDRALDMYKSSTVSDAEKFKMYEDFLKSTGQKK